MRCTLDGCSTIDTMGNEFKIVFDTQRSDDTCHIYTVQAMGRQGPTITAFSDKGKPTSRAMREIMGMALADMVFGAALRATKQRTAAQWCTYLDIDHDKVTRVVFKAALNRLANKRKRKEQNG